MREGGKSKDRSQPENIIHVFAMVLKFDERLDGYTPVIFYDFADYITSLCNDPILLNQFREQLNHLVPYKTHTKNFYTMAKGIIPINTFSGITTSDPSDNPMTVLKENTLWYKAAHN